MCVWVGGRICLLVSRCVCASADDTIAWLASGSSRVMQKLLVVLLIPLCQCHKKHHQSSETGGPDHPPYSHLCRLKNYTSPYYYRGLLYTVQMSVLNNINHRSGAVSLNRSRSLQTVNTDMADDSCDMLCILYMWQWHDKHQHHKRTREQTFAALFSVSLNVKRWGALVVNESRHSPENHNVTSYIR